MHGMSLDGILKQTKKFFSFVKDSSCRKLNIVCRLDNSIVLMHISCF